MVVVREHAPFGVAENEVVQLVGTTELAQTGRAGAAETVEGERLGEASALHLAQQDRQESSRDGSHAARISRPPAPPFAFIGNGNSHGTSGRLAVFYFLTPLSITFTFLEMARPKEFDRDEALMSALSIFRKKGFSATSTDDLRLAMGIGRQSFYDTFKGKKETYLEALRKYNSDRVFGYFEIFRKSHSPMKAIEDMLVSIALEHPGERALACLGVASVCEFGTSDADVRSINDASISTMQAVLEKLLTEAKAKKQLRPSLDPGTTAAYLQSTLAGLRVTAKAGASRETLKAIATIAVDGLKAQ